MVIYINIIKLNIIIINIYITVDLANKIGYAI